MTTGDCIIETASPEATRRLGAALAAMLPRGAVVALRGELATGKTCLVSGMAGHFAEADYVHSPTFTLVNQYGQDPALLHVDLYRLGGPDEVADLGYAELFDSEDVCVVEWAERAETLLPDVRLDIYLELAGRDLRRLTFHNRRLLGEGWQERLKRAAGD
ncbi:MAG TPA: tRNA (adenosine(37)-N6)-threonylcarbamoyltransferase complex ATPase subunit type 1 TsaE [Candidatus Hydrogenedentes bacterium]|jgi:tRNA threonylcarbamoyladenosine biosynthesis protein TsaE|nr:tRNA (adenosine(37)-N6)-threonylcarbamoyltransferase complex ATPase subunit type 1 TsaE [Candidatus Hydrogenedentota bacterium]MDY0030573.1 tRNA (adenosine(37)-N6)-threonylcarbamoyltransferase complex ATPase subunit type 1 TsaE [FCB group bacterium]HNZ18415.1 tRNA (adenosine(37)-N6)-threonylcarbamoyltransferase complex ATPase subunit type 1 TsaE [Candidatus Hydrogenedentota bacterium]HOH34193.1 tRNA (adenosine(37)-N6)-threonylcarbamoyltransferase complex ATPase subunit type 1 TsaE [Candidatus